MHVQVVATDPRVVRLGTALVGALAAPGLDTEPIAGADPEVDGVLREIGVAGHPAAPWDPAVEREPAVLPLRTEGSPDLRAVRDGVLREVEAWLAARGAGVRFGAAVRDQFALDASVTFLNHGSFGATPRAVLEAQRRWITELEAQPVAFFRALPPRVRRAAGLVADALGADPDDLVFVDNATSGVTAVVRSLRLQPGDTIVTTDHAYGAVRKALDHAVAAAGARLVVAQVPFPLDDPAQVLDAVDAALQEAGPARLAVFDHLTSITGLVLPVQALVERCRARGVPVLIDGAHVPGHLPLDLRALGADYWVGNLHKWLFAPKGCAVLHVRRDRQAGIDPLSWSHGIDQGFSARFDFQGTRDPSPWLSAEDALGFQAAHGADRIRLHNVRLRRLAGAAWCERFGVRAPAPESMLGALQTLPLPFPTDGTQAEADALNKRLWEDHRIEAMFVPFRGRVWVRIAAQIYNRPEEYAQLGDRLRGYSSASSTP